MPRKPNQRKEYAAHYNRVERYASLLDGVYAQSAAEFTKLALSANHNPSKAFRWSDYPETKRKADELLRGVASNIQTVVINGATAEWEESNFKNDRLARSVVGKGLEGDFKQYFNNNADALQSFIGRKQKGLNLSQKVWKLAEQYKSDLELALSIGLSDGRSAAELSRDIRGYLKEPAKLFRRIRDKEGDLQLSQAAKAYHPGAGTYRSSYKNAMRLTRTEINMAYRTADSVRYGQLDFVVGFEVKRSGRGYDCSVCESLAGKYPKDFKFVGWHPQCRCYVIPILKTDDEFWSWDGREEAPISSVNEVTDVPSGYKGFMADNKERITKAEKNGTLPYFLRDNKKYADFKQTAIEASTPKLPTILERTANRHAARTPQQIEDIHSRWDKGSNVRAVERELGVMQGGPMSFKEANELRGNPNYIPRIITDENGRRVLNTNYTVSNGQYHINCQSCVVANEMRRRGCNIQALGNIKGSIPEKLSMHTELAWTEKNNMTPKSKRAGGAYMDGYKVKNKTHKVMMCEFSELTSDAGRYHISFGWKGSRRSGHIITAERLKNGTMRFYDPQNGALINDFNSYAKDFSLSYGVRVLRVDLLDINTEIIKGIVTRTR